MTDNALNSKAVVPRTKIGGVQPIYRNRLLDRIFIFFFPKEELETFKSSKNINRELRELLLNHIGINLVYN